MCASTCILVRSLAMVNMVGVWNDAATVCPTSTARETTIPSIGLVIRANSRLAAAMSRSARACSTLALVPDRLAAICSRFATALSTSCCETSLCSRSSLVRFSTRTASLSWACAFSTSAWALARPACALSRVARKSRGSRSASGWPFFTCELKSTYSLETMPETWLPMLTVMMALTSPVAETTSLIGPRVTSSVRKLVDAPRLQPARARQASERAEDLVDGGQHFGPRLLQPRHAGRRDLHAQLAAVGGLAAAAHVAAALELVEQARHAGGMLRRPFGDLALRAGPAALQLVQELPGEDGFAPRLQPPGGRGPQRAAGAEQQTAHLLVQPSGPAGMGGAAARPCKRLLALAAAAAACASKDDPAARQRPAPLVAVAHPRVRDVEVAVRAPVDLRPLLTADIGSRTLGYLDAVLVDRGDRVKRGQVVALVRPSDLPDQLAAARAAATQSRASARLARANQERAALLAPSGRISRQELQQSEAALAAAEAQQASARAQVAALATRLGETRITAPLDGVISGRRLDPGALVGPSSGNTGPILTVDQIDALRCFVTVNERDAISVRIGQQSRIDLDAAPGRPYLGKVVRIAPSLDPLTRTLEAEVQSPNGSGELRPGMYGRAAIVTAVHERAVTLPVQAVQISGGRRIAFVLQGDRVRRREVQIGVDGEDWLEITHGLSPEDEVVIAGIEGLAEGSQVRPARNADLTGGAAAGEGADAGAPEGRRPAIPVRD